jgi:predicted metal-binding membrane protein
VSSSNDTVTMSVPTALAATRRDVGAEWRRLRWNHPEWTLAAVATAAWLLIFVTADAAGGRSVVAGAGHRHHGAVIVDDRVPHGMSATHTALMVIAMMLPTILPAARLIALTGAWKRRQRGPALFALGYLAVWIGVGVLATVSLSRVALTLHGRWPLAIALVFAAVWELTVWKPRFLRACHRHPPVPPNGWKADRACVQRGMRNAVSCLGACWAIMTPMLVADHVHALWLMVPLTAAILYQKMGTASRVVRPVAVGLVAAAVVVALW